MEAKIDMLIRLQAGARAEGLIMELDERYLRQHGHARPIAHAHMPVKIDQGDEQP